MRTERRCELAPLAFSETADPLGGGEAAAIQDSADPGLADPWHGQQQIAEVRGHEALGRIGEKRRRAQLAAPNRVLDLSGFGWLALMPAIAVSGLACSAARRLLAPSTSNLVGNRGPLRLKLRAEHHEIESRRSPRRRWEVVPVGELCCGRSAARGLHRSRSGHVTWVDPGAEGGLEDRLQRSADAGDGHSQSTKRSCGLLGPMDPRLA